MTPPPTSQAHPHALRRLLLVFLLLISLATLPFPGDTQNINQEQTLLLSFKRHWSNPPALAHWTPSSDHCTWAEVRCDDRSRSVTGIAIINASITNTIPPSICLLTNLTHLDLRWNFIPGPFPTHLYNCSGLQRLDLSENYFVGPIPDDVDRLPPSLRYLDLTANNFTGDIPPSVGGLKGIISLRLAGNLFNGSFPPEIGGLHELEELVLSYNSFAPQPIPSAFANLMKLKNLWMTETNLIGKIPDGISNMTAMESLDLSVNNLSGFIPDGIFLLHNLTQLFLYRNQFSGDIPRRVQSPKLEIIDLSNNELTGTIPEDFGNLTKLTGMALFFNQLSGEVPAGIAQLPGIVDIKLFNNNLSGELPSDFGLHSPLKTFQISSNRFSGHLPEHLCANKALIGLIIFENILTGRLPDSLGHCTALTIVRAHDNRLSGTIPSGLWMSVNLTTLVLDHNSFSGRLPDRIGPRLSLIQLADNEFSGPIPKSISSWNGLIVFRASDNFLTGTIHSELTSLSSITAISLDGNRFSGPLPPDIISWTSLETLDLSRNCLSGDIPEALGNLPRLNYLDLSENMLSGRIPLLSKLSYLDISSNNLSGRIPGEFENSAFERSFLRNPGLCSNTPSLGLPDCHVARNGNSRRVSSRSIAIASSLVVTVVAAFVVVSLYVAWMRRACRKTRQISWKVTWFERLNFSEAIILSSLTDGNEIGRGGSGRVYRVPISHSPGRVKYVAVKKILLGKGFEAEVGILGTVRHVNIVRLVGYISSEECKLLVYEYVENKSLDRWLHGKNGRAGREILDWAKRLRIAIGASQGLCYMHHHCSPPIIHRDVKSSNVLLDSEFNAKIADFGLAKMLAEHDEPNTMSVVVGSFGYMAPEYARTKRANEKIDVYGFGVILLELVTGREAHFGDEALSIVDWAWNEAREGQSMEQAIDEGIKSSIYLYDMVTVLRLGLMCTSSFPSNRPSMNDVLQILLRCEQTLISSEKGRMGNEHDDHPLLPPELR